MERYVKHETAIGQMAVSHIRMEGVRGGRFDKVIGRAKMWGLKTRSTQSRSEEKKKLVLCELGRDFSGSRPRGNGSQAAADPASEMKAREEGSNWKGRGNFYNSKATLYPRNEWIAFIKKKIRGGVGGPARQYEEEGGETWGSQKTENRRVAIV